MGSVAPARRAELTLRLGHGRVGRQAGAVDRRAVGRRGTGRSTARGRCRRAACTSSWAAARPRVRSPTLVARLLPLSAAAKTSAACDVPLSVSRVTGSVMLPSPAEAAVICLGTGPALAGAERPGRDKQPCRGKAQRRRPLGRAPQVDDQVPGALLAQGRAACCRSSPAVRSRERRDAHQADARPHEPPGHRGAGASSRTSVTSCGSAALPRKHRERDLRARARRAAPGRPPTPTCPASTCR